MRGPSLLITGASPSKRGDPRAVEGRRHHQQLEILAQALLRIARQRKAEIGIERALVEFVEQHRRDALERRIVEDQPREDALGDDLDAGARARPSSRSERESRRFRRPPRQALPPCGRRPRAPPGGAVPAPGFCGPSPTARRASTSGTRVVLPAPGGATSTAALRSASTVVSCGNASSIGSASVPLPKFAIPCSTSNANFGSERTLADILILVWFRI